MKRTILLFILAIGLYVFSHGQDYRTSLGLRDYYNLRITSEVSQSEIQNPKSEIFSSCT